MCQANSHGHHGLHSHPHRSRPNQLHRSARHDAVEPDQPTRRQVLGRLKTAALVTATSGLPWGSLVRRSSAGQPPSVGTASARLFDLKKVADGIYGAIAKPAAMLNCNAAVIVNRDHVLVVDTHSNPSAAKALIRQIRNEITDRPVKYVVDSHLHGDHAMGNEAYLEVFGTNVEMISSVKTREWLEKLGLPRLKESLDGLPRQIADLRNRLETSKDESERDSLRAHLEGLISYRKRDDTSARNAPDDDLRAAARHPPRRPGDPSSLPGSCSHGRRRRRLRPLTGAWSQPVT